jgi:protein TonB
MHVPKLNGVLDPPSEQATSSAPTLLKYVAPIYPTEARSREIEGWIQVSVKVTPAGDVASARIEDGQKRQLFSRAALVAVKQWKYVPQPDVSGERQVSVRLDFQLTP